MNNMVSGRALGFLLWFRKYYNGSTQKVYKKVAEDYQQANYGTVRVYMLELEAHGFITIENKGKHTQKYTVVEEKFQELL